MLFFGILLSLSSIVCADTLSNGSLNINPNSATRGAFIRSLALLFEESLNVFAPVSEAFDNDLCRQHSLLYKQGVLEKKLWALTMFDASAKIPSGVLTGNLVQLGNYDECVGLVDVDTVHGRFSGQHCQVTVGASSYTSETSTRKKLEFEMGDVTYPTMGDHPEEFILDAGGLPFAGATWSLCIPSSCRPRDLELHLRATLGPGLPIRVPDMSCSSLEDPGPKPTAGDYAAMILLALLAVLLFVSTTYDLVTSDEIVLQRSPSLLLSFSVYSNALSIMTSERDGKQRDLPVIDGVRVLSTHWVILAHHFFMAILAPTMNLDNAKKMGTDWLHIFVSNATLAVDSFLVISGTLVCYNFLLKRDRGIKFSLVRYYWDRYVRVTPLYAFNLLLTGTLVKFITILAQAPAIKENLHMMQGNCHSYGWLGLAYLNNYLDTDRLCVGIAWSLAVDMQLFLLSPLLLFPLYWRPKIGKAILGALIAIGLSASFVMAYIFKKPALNFLLISLYTMATNAQYYHTHARFTPWLIGIGLGYFLHQYKKSPVAMSRGVALIGWTLSAFLIVLVAYIGHQVSQMENNLNRLTTAFSLALVRPAFSLSLAWLIYACSTGNGGFVNTFLTWRLFYVLSKLSYAVFYSHYMVLYLNMTLSKKITQHFNDISMIVEYLGITVLSYMLGFIFTLTVELPTANLARAISETRVVDLKKNS